MRHLISVLLAFLLFAPTSVFAADPFNNCSELRARDGRYEFVWKPSGAHRKEAVLVLPHRFRGAMTKQVRLYLLDGTFADTMPMKSNGICAPGGECLDRPTFFSHYTGKRLLKKFGPIIIRVKTALKNCYLYEISDPSKRFD